MSLNLHLEISRDESRRCYKMLISILVIVIMLATTGCESRPYMNGGGNGEGSAAAVYLLPLILANEVALYAIEKKKQTAAEAHEAELLARVRRFEELKVLSIKGDAALQHELAFCYHHGHGAIRDVERAVFWYEKSAVQGYAEAQNDLGLCYFNEIGVRLDKVEACAWWSLAAPFHERAKASLAFVESGEGSRMTPPAFADFKALVHRRTTELRALVGPRAVAREPLSNTVQPEAAQTR
jgi:TPR repeat protein